MNGNHLYCDLNLTQIVLVPQKKEVVKVVDFRPVRLCNVVMKLITKVLTNRLSECLPSIISQSQSAFVRGRIITDNIILAHETSHVIRRRKRGANGLLSIKIDMSKEYNRVEWRFLKELLSRLDFHPS